MSIETNKSPTVLFNKIITTIMAGLVIFMGTYFWQDYGENIRRDIRIQQLEEMVSSMQKGISQNQSWIGKMHLESDAVESRRKLQQEIQSYAIDNQRRMDTIEKDSIMIKTMMKMYPRFEKAIDESEIQK